MSANENLRGWTRGSRRFPEREQQRLLEEAGYVVQYSAAEHDLSDLIRSLREGDTVGVATLGRLATNRVALRKAMDAIATFGVAVHEVLTGRRSDDPKIVAQMVLDAVEEITRDGRGLPSANARKFQALSVAVRREKIEAARAPLKDAQAEWFSVLNRTTGDALAKMPGWTMNAAYREIGPRGISVGRPSKGIGRPRARVGDEPRVSRHMIYFARSGADGPVKIGTSTSVDGRLKSMQTGHAAKLNLIATMDGGAEVESMLHKRFKHLHVHGEWFKYEGRLKSFIEKLIAKQDPAEPKKSKT